MNYSSHETDMKAEVQFISRINKKLEQKSSYFKSKFEYLKEKFNDRSIGTLTPNRYNDKYLFNLKKNLEICEKDYTSLQSLVILRKDPSKIILNKIQANKVMEQKLHDLSKENERLNKRVDYQEVSNTSRSELKKTEINLFELKSNIEKTEKAAIHNQSLIQNYTEKINKLQKKYTKLSNNYTPDSVPLNPIQAQFNQLTKKLKIIELNRKNNEYRYKAKILELEKESEILAKQHFKYKAQLFKKNQQKRLMEMSENEMILNKLGSKTPTRGDIHQADASFLYKPTVNKLYI
jgi:hypothetical protein